jgi:hypothetical protein
MYADKPIDELIRAGWEVIETDYHAAAFQNWRQKAFSCLVQLLGPDHIDTQYFENHIRQFEKKDLLSGNGIPSDAKEEPASVNPEFRTSGHN